jgi:hypothetical protein
MVLHQLSMMLSGYAAGTAASGVKGGSRISVEVMKPAPKLAI